MPSKTEHGDERRSGGAAGRFFEEIRIEFLVHELKDPIAVVETNLRSLVEKREKYGELNPRQEKILLRALRNARKSRQMLNDLLEIGRSEAACFACCAFRPHQVAGEALMEALETAQAPIFEAAAQLEEGRRRIDYLASCGIHFLVDADVCDLELIQDQIKFRQIVANLIKNALYHRNQQIQIKLSRQENTLWVDVTDDGPGIAPEHHQLVFQQYVQLDPQRNGTRQGHGLGLAGARILARCLGGDIVINSRKGRGANFRLAVPIHFDNG
jgi:two-component system, OmpR family, sensor kinase